MLASAFKRLVAKVSIAAVLFAQLVVAAYACPALMSADGRTAFAMTEALDAAMSDCEKLDNTNPNLCLQHCQVGNQSVETTPHISVPAIAPMLIAIVEPISLISNSGITDTSVTQHRQTSPPPLVRFGVLRI